MEFNIAQMEPFNFYDTEADLSTAGKKDESFELPPLVGSEFLDLPDLDEHSVDLQQLIDRSTVVQDSPPPDLSSPEDPRNQLQDLLAQAFATSQLELTTDSNADAPMPVLELKLEQTNDANLPGSVSNPIFTIGNHELDLSLNAASILSSLAGTVPNEVPQEESEPVPSISPSSSSSSLKATPPSKSRRKGHSKGTEEYKQRRERNNVAVRKSRDKTKRQQVETQHKVQELSDENDRLQKKVDLLSKELSVLKGLFSNIGAVLPDQLKDIFK